ncbi:MAG: hypothetical protein KAG14_04415, partial [Mycoplasmataceae bacterium]|nr:hypothetical protein [Mycoplasmataceae bacterium]
MGKKIDIGLDIGIASVGWAVVDSDNGEIIKHGSRLFRTVDSPKDSSLLNAKRREQRSARRQKERRKTLRRDFVKFLLKNKIITLDDSDYTEKSYNLFIEKYITSNNEDIFEIRKEALTNKISDNNLVKIMFWYLNHRGYKYSIAEEKVVESKTIKGFPVDAQLEYIKKNGYLNGDFNRNIKHSDYLNEIKQIFKINPISFGESFIEYFNRQRSFELGPGSEKSISPFGRFYYDEDNNLMEHSTIWEKTVGKCSLFPEETRAPKNSAISSIFNLINDLVNIRINSKKISSKDIFNIIKIAFQYKGSSG